MVIVIFLGAFYLASIFSAMVAGVCIAWDKDGAAKAWLAIMLAFTGFTLLALYGLES